jgi:amidohydrolase
MLKKAQAIQVQLIFWRRDFHIHPELGFQEIRTSARVAEIAESFGCHPKRGVGKTGVVVEIGSGKPIIALRADMDALPLQEENRTEYVSQNPGVMHACGHDSHTSMLLGVLALLTREKFQGTVRFLFQPSEEVADERGISGAPAMVADGAMEGVELVLALHVDAATPVGDIRVEAGPASGGVDSWFGMVLGKGGHGAKPHETIDPFYLTGHVIFALNAIISRKIFAFEPAVVSIGSLHGGQTENVIPDRVNITGTLRYTEKRVQQQLREEIRGAFELTRSLGGDYELHFETGAPPMQNAPVAVNLIEQAASELLGDLHVLPFLPELGAEDFGSFSEMAPGAMFLLGTRIEGDERVGHNPRFDIDERAMPVGTAILAEATLKYLRQHEAGKSKP